MKTQLTKEQSIHLIDLGVPKEKARCELPIGDGEYVFSLTDLLEILPKETKAKYSLTPIVITFGGVYKGEGIDEWFAYYDDITETQEICAPELIDALYELTCWYYGEYLKSKKK